MEASAADNSAGDRLPGEVLPSSADPQITDEEVPVPLQVPKLSHHTDSPGEFCISIWLGWIFSKGLVDTPRREFS